MIIVLVLISMIANMNSQSFFWGKIISIDIESSWTYYPDILNINTNQQESWLIIIVIRSNSNDNGIIASNPLPYSYETPKKKWPQNVNSSPTSAMACGGCWIWTWEGITNGDER